MMRKKCFIGIMVALFVCFIATSCTKKDSSAQEELTENFVALVMGGQSIDPNHTWSTASNKSITVSVNLDAGIDYTVYFFSINPAVNADAQYIGMTSLTTGETKTVTISVPDNVSTIYAACYSPEGQAICLPVNGSEINFSGKFSSESAEPAPTIGNNWSVPSINVPSTSMYTSGDLVTPDNIDPEAPSDKELHILIDKEYTGILPALNSHTNLSVYVTGTWNLTFDQHFVKSNVLVVGKGGKVVIPEGFKLSNGGQDGTSATGAIIVLPGGEIAGGGTVEATADASSFYNGGSISVKEILLTGGTLYNAGNIGSNTLRGEPNNKGDEGQFINYATAGVSQTSGSALSILNAGTIGVTNTLTLSGASRMDDGSIITCSSVSLQGDGSSNTVLYMGNSAYLNCSGSIAINNYGVWGPSGSNYKSNALFRANGCNLCTTTAGNANTFMLDHIQLLLPTSFQGSELIGTWINGGGDGISSDRKTCFFGMEDPTIPEKSCMFYCFEFRGSNSIRDFDYNDLVLRVNTPKDNGDGTFTSSVDVVAIGSDMSISVFYNNEEFGTEAHLAMGIATKSAINTSSYTRQPRRLGDLQFTSDNIDLGRLPFSLQVQNSNGGEIDTYIQKGNNEAPLFIAINGDNEGKWFWPREGSNIGLAYLLFSAWANNQHTATNWYYSNNTSSSHIIRW